ncbi:hypothetical protein BC835DRAFT_1391578 [Cytidiella melzeri]|nr:hypothetical protein BC835DRAFT_1391578 [Cytidiella melzeri]
MHRHWEAGNTQKIITICSAQLASGNLSHWLNGLGVHDAHPMHSGLINMLHAKKMYMKLLHDVSPCRRKPLTPRKIGVGLERSFVAKSRARWVVIKVWKSSSRLCYVETPRCLIDMRMNEVGRRGRESLPSSALLRDPPHRPPRPCPNEPSSSIRRFQARKLW